MKLRFSALLLLVIVTACSGKPEKAPYGNMKIGKPYQVYGRWYKPKYESDYDEIGRASWYGPGFHAKKTANGENFDQNALTAAHRTLPMPSIVRVTNLDNGKSLVVRVNDRGPFSRDRILDLSKAAATELGLIRTGTAKVRVQFLEQETIEYVESAYGKGVKFADSQIKEIDPIEAGKVQDVANNVQFVPVGETPPEGSVPMSPKVPESETYVGKNIFEAVDNENRGNEPATLEAAVAESAPQQPERVVYKEEPPFVRTEYKPAGNAVEPTAQPVANGYYILAGTFGSKTNAARLADSMPARIGDKDEVKILPSAGAGAQFYRVMVGPFQDAGSAKNTLSKVKAAGIPDARVIRN